MRTGRVRPTITRVALDEVIDYDAEWPERFVALAGPMRDELGALALRIDHIGSTAVPHLAAKPIIDIQVSVAALEPVSAYRFGLERCGFEWRTDNPDLTKRYFRERPGSPRTHIHVRRSGSFAEQFALLFRDYLREDPTMAAVYAVEKRRLAHLLTTDRERYTAMKGPIVWRIARAAAEWSQLVGWEPSPSDG